jgi:hypothetical protein
MEFTTKELADSHYEEAHVKEADKARQALDR